MLLWQKLRCRRLCGKFLFLRRSLCENLELWIPYLSATMPSRWMRRLPENTIIAKNLPLWSLFDRNANWRWILQKKLLWPDSNMWNAVQKDSFVWSQMLKKLPWRQLLRVQNHCHPKLPLWINNEENRVLQSPQPQINFEMRQHLQKTTLMWSTQLQYRMLSTQKLIKTRRSSLRIDLSKNAELRQTHMWIKLSHGLVQKMPGHLQSTSAMPMRENFLETTNRLWHNCSRMW